MRTVTREDIRRVVSEYIQPLYTGVVDSVNGTLATLTKVVPFGTGKSYRMAFPFGFVSAPTKGVMAYVTNLGGSALGPVIQAYLDKNRPSPSAPGEVIVYCQAADGSSIPVKMVLGNDGTLTITASTKVVVNADDVELGASTLQKVINGEDFLTFFNAHEHEGNLGVPTGPPIVAMDTSLLSTQVKASK